MKIGTGDGTHVGGVKSLVELANKQVEDLVRESLVCRSFGMILQLRRALSYTNE